MSIVLSPKLHDIGEGKLVHWCPGCKARHVFHTQDNHPNGQKWYYSDGPLMPSFYPSMHIRGKCHYFLEQGQLRFLVDSSHRLAGCTVALPDLPE